ncbi:uncharacterized protein BDCG_01061 [Blastomyces dermatitidis ER-3]|uniref:Uncharacterized protein n=1 Tax=Ajellomyces dermatitidis (strain ER-3 / ATCC MYA-2586) TaxID=559297 RepID=A0ABP2ELV0_AJEDR|nr:uncharacterized protein BDCG_01061 [Blastomyces dermatitidis ER-3]EEQ84256.1 hypothetical protein BDCG_01061 [Blastomyces dermatitidis ER-3]
MAAGYDAEIHLLKDIGEEKDLRERCNAFRQGRRGQGYRRMHAQYGDFAVYFILARDSSKAENSFDTRTSAADGLSARLTTNMRRRTSLISAIVSNNRNSSAKYDGCGGSGGGHRSIAWPL